MSALNPEDFAAVRSEVGEHLTAEEPAKKRRITTKVMCGWCAGTPISKGNNHIRCTGYDEESGKGCLCAAYGHQPVAKVVAHQARYCHIPEERVHAHWTQLGEDDGETNEVEVEAEEGAGLEGHEQRSSVLQGVHLPPDAPV